MCMLVYSSTCILLYRHINRLILSLCVYPLKVCDITNDKWAKMSSAQKKAAKQVVRLLLQYGANPLQATCDTGATPLSFVRGSEVRCLSLSLCYVSHNDALCFLGEKFFLFIFASLFVVAPSSDSFFTARGTFLALFIA